MKHPSQLQIWDLWYSKAGATGIPFARGRLDATTILLVHAPPPMLTIEVRSESGERVAHARDLEQTADRPMARLTMQGETITRKTCGPRRKISGEWSFCWAAKWGNS